MRTNCRLVNAVFSNASLGLATDLIEFRTIRRFSLHSYSSPGKVLGTLARSSDLRSDNNSNSSVAGVVVNRAVLIRSTILRTALPKAFSWPILPAIKILSIIVWMITGVSMSTIFEVMACPPATLQRAPVGSMQHPTRTRGRTALINPKTVAKKLRRGCHGGSPSSTRDNEDVLCGGDLLEGTTTNVELKKLLTSYMPNKHYIRCTQMGKVTTDHVNETARQVRETKENFYFPLHTRHHWLAGILTTDKDNAQLRLRVFDSAPSGAVRKDVRSTYTKLKERRRFGPRRLRASCSAPSRELRWLQLSWMTSSAAHESASSSAHSWGQGTNGKPARQFAHREKSAFPCPISSQHISCVFPRTPAMCSASNMYIRMYRAASRYSVNMR